MFTTVDGRGIPNAIYVGCVAREGEDTLVVADNYFDKTRHNIMTGSPGSLLFMTRERKAYQVKGRLTYHRSGSVFDAMKTWNPQKHPGHAAVALTAEEAYCGAVRLL